jgi:signal transduction histidine kinase
MSGSTVLAPPRPAHRIGWSLKRQIVLLALLALGTVASAAFLGAQVLHETEAARVGDAAQQLERAANRLAERYDYLRGSLGAHGGGAAPLNTGDENMLHSLTESSLGGLPGVEGGFYAAQGSRLLGYAYPTYEGSGPKTDIPAAERPTIERVAERAVATHALVTEEVPAGSDVILFQAQPLLEDGTPIGAVWLMHRLTGVRSPQHRLYLAALLLLLSVAAVSTAVSLLFTRRLDRGVARIEGALHAMEERFDTAVPAVGITELDRIGAAITQLGQTLHEHAGRRAALEVSLRQADRLAVLGRMVAGVAHEVRNPLASIKLKLHLTRGAWPSAERLHDTFEVIQAEVDRLDRLVERLLLLGRPWEPAGRPTDLSHFLGERLGMWEARAAAQRTRVEVAPTGASDGSVTLDRDRVGQILDNLVTNALEALAGQGGAIRIEVERPSSNAIILVVTDTGPGVPPEAAAHIFEPFFTTKDGGTGLGLFLSAELARRLGGELRYRPPPEGGARFEVQVPC